MKYPVLTAVFLYVKEKGGATIGCGVISPKWYWITNKYVVEVSATYGSHLFYLSDAKVNQLFRISQFLQFLQFREKIPFALQ